MGDVDACESPDIKGTFEKLQGGSMTSTLDGLTFDPKMIFLPPGPTTWPPKRTKDGPELAAEFETIVTWGW